MSAKENSGITPYALYLARKMAGQLVGKHGFTGNDLEDIQQELLLDVMHRSRNYDPAKCQYSTFLHQIIPHAISHLIEHHKAEKRGQDIAHLSIDAPLENNDDQDGAAPRMELKDDQRLVADRTFTPLEFKRAWELMSEPERALASELANGASVHQAGRQLGLSRRQMQKLLAQLRQLFKGMEE